MTTVAVVGGTGDLGLGLACRLAGNYEVIIGSREAERAKEAASKASLTSKATIIGMTNDEATASAEITILAIPDIPSDEVLLQLKPNLEGKLLICPIVPMRFHDGLFHPATDTGSAAEKVSSVVKTRVAAALHNVPAARLSDLDRVLDYDVLVAADERSTFDEASKLIASIEGLRPLYSGPLWTSRTLESLTPILLNVGKLNKIKFPSLKVV
jgi:8-hydroxy-5-deazaflavin:NADPH oxidoreductase